MGNLEGLKILPLLSGSKPEKGFKCSSTFTYYGNKLHSGDTKLSEKFNTEVLLNMDNCQWSAMTVTCATVTPLHIRLAEEQQENWPMELRDQTESHISLKNIHYLPQQLLVGLSDEQLQSLGEVNHLYPWDRQSHPSPQRTHTKLPLLYCYLQWRGTSTCALHCEEDSGNNLN